MAENEPFAPHQSSNTQSKHFKYSVHRETHSDICVGVLIHLVNKMRSKDLSKCLQQRLVNGEFADGK